MDSDQEWQFGIADVVDTLLDFLFTDGIHFWAVDRVADIMIIYLKYLGDILAFDRAKIHRYTRRVLLVVVDCFLSDSVKDAGIALLLLRIFVDWLLPASMLSVMIRDRAVGCLLEDELHIAVIRIHLCRWSV